MKLTDIDVEKHSFSIDVPHFWDKFDYNTTVPGGIDPDSSDALKEYQELLWNARRNYMGIDETKWQAFKWSDHDKESFSCDAITNGMRWACMSEVISDFKTIKKFTEEDYKKYVHDYVFETYKIGGEIIFPGHRRNGCATINQSRGSCYGIYDRWDLALDCIRLFYSGDIPDLNKHAIYEYYIKPVSMNGAKELSIYDTVRLYADFFEMFGTFEKYVEFFFLEDCVDNNGNVLFWTSPDGKTIPEKPLPQNAEEYYCWLEKCRDFVNKRTARIKKFVTEIS